MRVQFPRSTEGERDGETESDRRTDSELAVRLVQGCKAGFMATLTMTVFRLPLSRSLPPTARFWATFVSGGDPDDHPIAAIALHVLYGVIGGGVFGALVPIDRPLVSNVESRTAISNGKPWKRTSDAESRATAYREATGMAWGALYGLALSVFGERVVLERLLDVNPKTDERFVFHASHLVYGLSLGTWFGSRTSDQR